MFGINGPEFILLLIIGVLVIGPSRLPEYTQKLANLVKEVRRMASGAREQIKEEVGIDIDERIARELGLGDAAAPTEGRSE